MPFEENVPNEQLRRARHLKEWTQIELAERLGSDFETVSRWERGITVPNAYFREKLCRILDKTAEELELVLELQEPLIPHTSSYVFLSSAYADAENEFLTHLKATLQARGITVLSNRALRRQGAENKRKALQETIRAAQAVLLIASPQARSSRSVQEALQLAKIYNSRVCVVWIDGRHWQECIPKDSGEFFAIIDARKNKDIQGIDEIIAALKVEQPTKSETEVVATTINETEELTVEPRNPYKGLKAFRGEDRHDFFGRDSLIEELATALQASLSGEAPGAPNARLLSLVGPSGSGKSSVVFAGLLPALQAGALSGSEEWVYLDPMVPGVHPIESLTLALARQFPERSLRTIRDDLEDETARGLHLIANHLRTRPERYVVLFVDQLEEVFTQTTSEEERRHFIDLLVTAVTEPQGPIIVILTLRADFYDRPMHYPELSELLKVSQKLVLPMDLKGLREAIEKPAGLPDVQLVFEGDLIGDLLFEVQGQVGATPLLQFTLDQLFQRRRNHQLTLQAYSEIGGVKGAMARYAESTYASLPTGEHREMARALFLRLIDPGLSEQDTTRRRAALAEISLPDAKLTIITGEVVDAFVSSRLLTTNEIGGITTVEVSHEALIREWPRLTGWLREGREDIRMQQAISEDSIEWEQRGKPKDRLYRGSQLTDAKIWARRNFPSWSEVAFLHASARQHMRYVVNILLVIILLASTTGLSGWLITRILRPSPSPTLVTNLHDDGSGSLRLAIANASPGSTITFDTGVRGTILLSSGDLNIQKSLKILGPGPGILVISRTNLSYTVHVYENASIAISGLSFRDSSGLVATPPGNYPPLISNYGTLTLTNDLISNSNSNGIESMNGSALTLTSSTVSDNTVAEIVADQDATVTLTNSTVSGNNGSGIVNNGGTVSLMNSAVSGNTASNSTGCFFQSAIPISSTFSLSDSGGGICNGGILTLTNSTVSGNTAAGNANVGDVQSNFGPGQSNIGQGPQIVEEGVGGGIYNGGILTLTNSTISGNTAKGVLVTGVTKNMRVYSGLGGGIYNDFGGDNGTPYSGGKATITFCTIYTNTANGKGGGIFIQDTGHAQIRASIVAGNDAHSSPDISGSLTSYGYNLFQDNSGATFNPSTQHSTDKMLSVNDLTSLFASPVGLRYNNGTTKTLALAPDSYAIDQIPLDACLINGITTDQRGMPRPDRKGEQFCDIGAYESSG